MIDADVDIIDLKLSKYNINSSELLNFKKTVLFDSSIKSDLICIEYTDKLFISVSTSGKFGTVVLVKSEKVAEETIYTVKNLFGQYESSLHVFCRSLAEKILTKRSITKPILVTIGIKKEHLERFDLFKFLETQIIESYNKSN